MNINELPGAESQEVRSNGDFRIVSPFNADPEAIKAAVDAVIIQDAAFARGANTSHHVFQILLDQILEKVPTAHPLDAALKLHAALNSGSPITGVIQNAFQLGVEVASLLKQGTRKHQAERKAQVEIPDQAIARMGEIARSNPV